MGINLARELKLQYEHLAKAATVAVPKAGRASRVLGIWGRHFAKKAAGCMTYWSMRAICKLKQAAEVRSMQADGPIRNIVLIKFSLSAGGELGTYPLIHLRPITSGP